MSRILLALPVLCLVAGCQKAVTIVAPDIRSDRPVTSITVQFSQRFKPGTFHATLDGKDITGLFSPVPAPGQKSSAEIGGGECGFEYGEAVARPPPPPNRPVGVDTRPADSSPSSGQVGGTPPPPPPASSSGSNSIPPPPTDLTVFWHRIIVDADCQYGWACEGDERAFLPPHLVGVPIKLPLTVGQRHYLEIEVWPKVVVPVDVRAWPENTSVRLDGGTDGAATNALVPPSGRSSPILVEGRVRPTQYKIWLCARGTQRGLVSGTIN